MIKRIVFAVMVLLPLSVFAQTPLVDKLVNEGVGLFDAGKYDEAIAKYQKALSLSPKSMAARYELAYTWFTKGDYDKAIEHSRIVYQVQGDYWVDGAVIYGASLECKGLSKKAVKVFEPAIAKSPNNAELRYNAALSYFKLKDYAKAENYLMVAIEQDRANPSAHLLLANVAFAKGDKVKCAMALYYFLLIEQDSERCKQAFTLLTTINDHLVKSGQIPASSKPTDSKKSGTDAPTDVLTDHVAHTMGFLGQLAANKWPCTGFWKEKYVDFLMEIHQKGYGNALAYFTAQCSYKDAVVEWSTKNYGTFNGFVEWMSKQ